MIKQPTACTDMELSRRICAKESPDREAALNDFVNATMAHNLKAFAMLAHKWGIQEVNDYFNDTFVAFYEYSLKLGHKQEAIKNLCGAFYTIGHHTLSKVVRRRKGPPLQGTDDLTVNMMGETDPEIERIINPDPDEQALIEAAMKQLSEDDQMILNLYYYEDLSHKQIAERLSIAEEVSKNRLSRARKRLRDYLNDCLNNQEK